MKHLGTKRLETERLILRPFTMEDAGAMYRNWASDPEVTRFLTWHAHGSVAVTQMVLADWVPHYAEEGYYNWAIVLKENGGEPIGNISAVRVDDRLELAHIGYCLGKQWWHRGIMPEALQTVIDFFFDEVGMNRVEAGHDTNNPNSGAVMRKCGMELEGTLRQSAVNNQGICDIRLYAILASSRKSNAGEADV